jgi:hypothetical protein
VAVNPAGAGNLQATAYGSALPTASIINFRAGMTLANGLVVALCNPSAATCGSDITVKANVSATDLVADVQGYFHRVDLTAVMPLGSGPVAPFVATGDSLGLADTVVQTPPADVDCVVTCSITVTSSAPNVIGHAYVQAGAKNADGLDSIWGGMPMFVAPVASAGASSATATDLIGLGASLRFQFGCFVSTTGDFIGDEVQGQVSWVCRPH